MELISRITAAEEKAASMLAEAREKAVAIIRQASGLAEKRLEEAARLGCDQAAELLSGAEAEAEAEAQAVRERTSEAGHRLTERAAAGHSEAVDSVIQEVMRRYGRSQDA